jgi:adenosine deaminase
VTVKRLLRIAAVVLLAAGTVAAAPPAGSAGEAATAKYFASIRNDPSLLLAFLTEMPKGGDLHNHLSGAIYAESYLQWAAADGLCVATAAMSITPAPCDAAAGRPPASDVVRNGTLYSQAIDAMSMRHWNPSLNGHDHFFATFGKFGPISSNRTDDMLAELAARAAAEHVSYLEVMVNTEGGIGAARGTAAGWDPDLPKLRDQLLATGFRVAVTNAARTRIDDAESRMRSILKCATPHADPGCRTTLRYIYQVLRASAPQSVFGQMLAGFEIATAEPRVVSVNLVQPEDDPTAVRDFSLQMSMLDYLHAQYPAVKLTLHAGELTDGLVAPETLRFHMRESIRTGHASRIGHGVDVMFEDDPIALLREMAAKKVLVEIALNSNDLILGVKGSRHPLRTYLRYGVPVALVTDDAGVSRSTLTLEYRKAVEEQGLDYRTLKAMARNSISYSFADAATKARLARDLETAFAAFERPPRTPHPAPRTSHLHDR